MSENYVLISDSSYIASTLEPVKRKVLIVLIAICSVPLALVMIAGISFYLSGKTLASQVSPNRKYSVEISQNRLVVERFVRLSAYRNGERFVRNKLLYTGDHLDDDFTHLYPEYFWVSESILKMGRKLDGPSPNGLKIVNESPDRISYLLIETYDDKYVLFDVEPGSVVNLKLQFLGRLSCQGETVAPKRHFGSAVKLIDDAEKEVSGNFSIRITANDVIIESPDLKLKTTTCCAADRPDINHEYLFW